MQVLGSSSLHTRHARNCSISVTGSSAPNRQLAIDVGVSFDVLLNGALNFRRARKVVDKLSYAMHPAKRKFIPKSGGPFFPAAQSGDFAQVLFDPCASGRFAAANQDIGGLGRDLRLPLQPNEDEAAIVDGFDSRRGCGDITAHHHAAAKCLADC